MKTATVRIKRIVCLVVAFLLAVSGMGISAHAASQFAIEGKSYELTDESSFEINENKSQDMLCYGAAHIGTLEVSGEVNEQTTYNSWSAIGVHGAVTLTYSYDGAYQTSNKEQWNLTTSSSKVVNGIDLGKKVENGAIIVEHSADGKKWETVSVQTNVFHKKSTDISIYTIDEADVRNGSYYRITMAYRMQQKTGTEYVLGIFPTDVYEYREFVEVREFYVCYNKDPITLRDVETGAAITGNQSTKLIGKGAGIVANKIAPKLTTTVCKKLSDVAGVITVPIGNALAKLQKAADGSVFYSKYIANAMTFRQLARLVDDGVDELADGAIHQVARNNLVDTEGNPLTEEALRKLFNNAKDGEVIAQIVKGNNVIDVVKQNGIVGIFFDPEKYITVDISRLVDDRDINMLEAVKKIKEVWLEDPITMPAALSAAIRESGDTLETITPNKLLSIIRTRSNGFVLHENIDMRTVTLVTRELHDTMEGGFSHMGGVALAKYVKAHMGSAYFERLMAVAASGLATATN